MKLTELIERLQALYARQHDIEVDRVVVDAIEAIQAHPARPWMRFVGRQETGDLIVRQVWDGGGFVDVRFNGRMPPVDASEQLHARAVEAKRWSEDHDKHGVVTTSSYNTAKSGVWVSLRCSCGGSFDVPAEAFEIANSR